MTDYITKEGVTHKIERQAILPNLSQRFVKRIYISPQL